MIRYENVRVSYGGFVAIHELDLEVREGEFFTMLGPSGSGKTTALRTLAGFIEPSAGDIYVAGKRVTRLPSDKRQIGMVFQNYALFPSLSVRENIAFGLKIQKASRQDVDRRVSEIAEQVDLSATQLEKNPADLSGGQQQRVAIARALVLRPKILLLDEPLSNLDAKLRGQLRIQLKDLQQEFGITTVYVTHDQDEALSMSDRIAVFNEGRVQQVGTPAEIYDRSATEFVCHFIGDASHLTPNFIAEINRLAGSDLDENSASYVRQEKVGLAPGLVDDRAVGVRGTVIARRYHGMRSSYDVHAKGSVVKVMHSESGVPGPTIGDDVTMYIDPRNILQYGQSPLNELPADASEPALQQEPTVRSAPRVDGFR